MRYKIILVICLCFVAGCANDLSIGELSSREKIQVIDSKVSNPYPECENLEKVKITRMADLEAERGERVYLQRGVLCQRSNY